MKLLSACVLALVPTVALAQPISYQCQYKPSGMPMREHVHFEPLDPAALYQQHTTTEPFTFAFRIQLHMVSGELPRIWGSLVSRVVWDDPTVTTDAWGTTTPPLMGDMDTTTVFTGHLTIDPMRGYTHPDRWEGDGLPPPHGWYHAAIRLRVNLTNGSYLNAIAALPFFSEIDPTAALTPELGGAEGAPSALCFPWSADDLAVRGPTKDPAIFGHNVLEVRSPLPTLSLTAPMTVTTRGYGYVPDPHLPQGEYQLRLDMDLHHGIEGTMLRSETTDNFEFSDLLDPAVIGAGAHKIAPIWIQNSGPFQAGVTAGDEEVWSLVVFAVSVGDVVAPSPPPPPPPPPPPLPTRHLIVPTFERDGNQFFICDGGCFELGLVP